ncbi:MAG: glycosyltransferase family 4 protein [Nitrososphaeria archaeon]
MKIKILVRILWPAGTQRIAILQTKALQNMGHDVELVFLRSTEKGERYYHDLLNGVNYRTLHRKNDSLLVSLYDYITEIFMSDRKGEGRVDYNFIRDFWKYLKNDEPELLVCHDQWAGLAGYYAKKKLGTRYIVFLHERAADFPWVKGIKRPLAKLALRYTDKILKNADALFAVTDAVSKTFEELHGLRVVTDFPGLSLYSGMSHEREDFLVAISNWSKVKFPDMYLHLMKELPQERLIMAGNWVDERYEHEFKQKVANEGLEKRVIIIGNISEEQKHELLLKAKAFVRFGLGEYGVATGTLEALEHLTPVIVNDELGISGMIEEKNLGFVIKRNDYSSVRSFLINLKDREFRDGLIRNMTNFVVENSWEKSVNKIISVVEKGVDFK